MNKLAIFIISVFLSSSTVDARPNDNDSIDVNRFRVSALFGLPRIAGFQFEYLTPLNKDRVALTADFSTVPSVIPSAVGFIRYTGFGVNHYFNQKGNGLYGGFEVGRQYIRLKEIDNDPIDVDVTFQWVSPKLGIVAGNRLFFRMELGYSVILFDIDKANDFLNETYGIQVNPKRDFLHLPNGSLGIGFSF